MVFWLFKKRDDKWKEIHDRVSSSFENVREDLGNVGKWIKHLESHRDTHHKKINDVETRLKILESLFEDFRLRNNFSSNNLLFAKNVQTGIRPKRTSVRVQTGVQTDIQTALRSLTPMERAVFFVLLNTDLKLSYDDLSVTLGKDKSTLRGQINNIKRKNESLMHESLDKEGKKRFYIGKKLKNEILKGISISKKNRK